MGAIVEAAVCGAIGKAILFFVILPMGVLFSGYLAYIIIEVVHEFRKSKEQRR